MTSTIHRALAGVAGVGLATTGALSVAGPAQSLPDPATAACPETFPVDDLVKGQPVEGLTVSSGTVPDAFSGEVLGVLRDFLIPDSDLIMVRLTSPEIDRVGGIWQGMSGSPVYAADGRLVGAVAWGLGFGSSPVAGVTPAAEMKDLIVPGAASPAARALRKVALPKAMQRRLVASHAATRAEASEGLAPLPTPLSVSGMFNSSRLAKFTKRLGLTNVRAYRAGAAPTAGPTATPASDQIFPGSNLAASISYGDASAIGFGTTTMVCDGKVVGFGHPFDFAGDTTLTMHGAETVYVQEDPLGAPFTVANATGPVGIVSGDHFAGISGALETLPDTTLVRTKVTVGARSRIGDTRVSVPDFAPDVTAFGLVANVDRVFDHIGKGTSLVRYTVTGSTTDGRPFTVSHANRFADDIDITFATAFEAADAVAALVFNEFKDVKIDQVRITTSIEPVNRAFRVSKVERKVGSTYQRITARTPVRAKRGSLIRLRVTLASDKNRFGSRKELISVRVPKGARPGMQGELAIGSAGGDDDEEEFLKGRAARAEDAATRSFNKLLGELAHAPRNDQLQAAVALFTEEDAALQASRTRLVGDVITGTEFFTLRITK